MLLSPSSQLDVIRPKILRQRSHCVSCLPKLICSAYRSDLMKMAITIQCGELGKFSQFIIVHTPNFKLGIENSSSNCHLSMQGWMTSFLLFCTEFLDRFDVMSVEGELFLSRQWFVWFFNSTAFFSFGLSFSLFASTIPANHTYAAKWNVRWHDMKWDTKGRVAFVQKYMSECQTFPN